MLQTIKITSEDILTQIKLSCKIPEITKQIVLRKVIENAAAKTDIKIENEELQEAADKFRLTNQLDTADDTWVWLEKHCLSLDDFEQIVYSAFLANKLTKHLFADKVEAYFFENQLNYMSVVMYEVVIDDEDLALELFYAIKEGETNFYNVAHEYIQDTELRRKCGYRGKVNRKDLKPEISAAIFVAKPPQLLKPIVTSRGVHLIFVEEIIQPELDNMLHYQIMSDLFAEWMKQEMDKIEVFKCLK